MAGYTKNQIEHFKEQLKLLMKSHNLTARKLSEEIGYSMNTISSLLTGKIKVHERHILLICQYFQIGENSLMGDADELADEILCRFKQKRQRDWQSKTCEKIERGKNGEFNFKQSKTMVY